MATLEDFWAWKRSQVTWAVRTTPVPFERFRAEWLAVRDKTDERPTGAHATEWAYFRTADTSRDVKLDTPHPERPLDLVYRELAAPRLARLRQAQAHDPPVTRVTPAREP